MKSENAHFYGIKYLIFLLVGYVQYNMIIFSLHFWGITQNEVIRETGAHPDSMP